MYTWSHKGGLEFGTAGASAQECLSGTYWAKLSSIIDRMMRYLFITSLLNFLGVVYTEKVK